MASFVVDFTEVRFAATNTGYKDITITGMPQAGVNCTITGTDASSFGYRIPGSDQNVYRVYTTSNTNIGVNSNQKTATFKITNLADNTDYVEVSLVQVSYYGRPIVRGVENVYDNVYAYYQGDGLGASYMFAEYRTDNVGTYAILYVDGYEGTTTLSESWAYYTAESAYSDTGFKQIKIGATNNYDSECKSCTITFPGSGGTGNSNILWQNPYPSSTAGCTSPIRFSGSGGTERITLKTDGQPAANIDYSTGYSNDGLTYTIVETGSGTLYYDVTVGANQSDNILKGAILFQRSSTHKVYGFTIVRQESTTPTPSLTADPAVLDYPASGGAKVLDVTYATSLSTNESSFPSWLSSTYVSVGPSERSYTITAASNSIAESRSFNFELADANMSLVVPITQAAGTPSSLDISPTSNSVGSSSGSVQITVTASGISDVQYSISDSWITYGSKSGDVYTFNYAEKTTTGQRTGTITFYGGGFSKTYTLIQVGATQIIVSPTSESVDNSSGSISVSVTGANNITYSISDNWLTFGNKSGDVYTFNYSANSTSSSRTATVTFSAPDTISGTYTITQAAESSDVLGALPSEVIFPSSGGEKTVRITYTGNIQLRDDAPDWITNINYDAGGSPKNYYISAAENTSEYARRWDAYFSDSVSSLYVPVTQNGTQVPSLSVSPSSGSVGSSSGSVGITVTASGIRNTDISYQISGNWLSYSSLNGYTFNFNYSANVSSSSRSIVITFTAYGKTAAYTLVQEGVGEPASLSISPTSKTVSAANGRVDITVNKTGIQDLQYAFSSNSSFIFSHTEGNVYVFSYGVNTSSLQTKVSRITFSGGGLYETFTLTQEPSSSEETLDLIPTSDSVDSSAGYVYITVSRNNISASSVHRTISGSWLSYVSSTDGIEKFLYRQNSTSNSRTATVTYTAEGITKVYTLIQSAGSTENQGILKVYPKKLRYYGEGGRKTVSFTNRPDDGIGYEITYIDGSGWLSITDLGPDKYVTATENSGIRRRASIRFYDVNDRSNYVIVPVIQGNIDGYDSIWMDDLFYPEDRDADGNYYYRVTDQNTHQNYFIGISAKPSGWGGNIGGIDIPRLVDEYLGSSINSGASNWEDMDDGYCTVDVYNMTEGGYPGVVDATFKYWNDWSRFERRYDYTRSLNDPINGKGCDDMIIPFCVYYDDTATFSIVDTEKNGNVNTYTLSSPSSPFAMRYDSFYDTKKLEYRQDDEVIFSYDMDHCGPGAFIYRNRFGGWDSFLIEGNISKTDNYTKLNWRRNGEYNQGYVIDSLKYIDEKVTDSVNIDTTFEAYTGWLSDEEAERLVFHLLSSPIVYFQNLHKENQVFDTDPLFHLMPIRITASAAEYKKFRNGKRLVNYLITFEKGNIEKVRN